MLAYIEEKEIYIRILFYIMCYAGLRVGGEVAELETRILELLEINFLFFLFQQKLQKGRKSRTAPYIDSHTSKILLDYANSKYKKISRISRRTIQYHARQVSKATGIRFSCHVHGIIMLLVY